MHYFKQYESHLNERVRKAFEKWLENYTEYQPNSEHPLDTAIEWQQRYVRRADKYHAQQATAHKAYETAYIAAQKRIAFLQRKAYELGLREPNKAERHAAKANERIAILEALVLRLLSVHDSLAFDAHTFESLASEQASICLNWYQTPIVDFDIDAIKYKVINRNEAQYAMLTDSTKALLHRNTQRALRLKWRMANADALNSQKATYAYHYGAQRTRLGLHDNLNDKYTFTPYTDKRNAESVNTARDNRLRIAKANLFQCEAALPNYRQGYTEKGLPDTIEQLTGDITRLKRAIAMESH